MSNHDKLSHLRALATRESHLLQQVHICQTALSQVRSHYARLTATQPESMDHQRLVADFSPEDAQELDRIITMLEARLMITQQTLADIQAQLVPLRP